MYPEDVDAFIQKREKKWFIPPESDAYGKMVSFALNLSTFGIWGLIFGSKCYHTKIYSKNGSRKLDKIKRQIEKTFKELNVNDPDEVLFVIDGTLIFTSTHLYYSLNRDKSLMANIKDQSIGSFNLSEIKSIEIGKKSFTDMQSIKVNNEIIGAINFINQERLIDFLKSIKGSI